jgi:glyoxylase-like metal-dependent hydrolase (beta-lactamase superfamily II)
MRATKHAGIQLLRSAALNTALVTFMAVAAASHAQEPTSPVIKINEEAAKADITTTAINDHMSVLSGSGGNITVLTGSDGKFLVDGGIALSKVRIAAALDAISNAPLKYLVDTHYHWDHTDSNVWLHEAGATIVATPNTLKRVSRSTRVDDWNFTFKPLAAGGLPTVLVTTPKTYNFDGQVIRLIPVAPAHTDSDLYVTFKPANVMVLGDLFWNGVYPFIDNENGGSIDGMIHADNEILAVATDSMVIVPGHGPVGNRAQLAEFRDMLVGIRKNVAALKKQGKTLAEAVAAKPTAAYDAKFGNFVISPDLFTKIVYDGLK